MSDPEITSDYQKLNEISDLLENHRICLSEMYEEWEELSEFVGELI